MKMVYSPIKSKLKQPIFASKMQT